jgi:lipoprotein LprG
MSKPALRASVVVAAALMLVACSGDEKSVSDDKSPEEVMELAATTLDDTSGVTVSLSSEGLPDGMTVLKAADGVGTHAPAFDGTNTVVLAGTDFNVPIVAVDDKVYAQIPLTPGWSEVDPADYGAPDPAQLMSTDDGFSALLSATEGVEEGDTVRGGEDNKEVLTEYTGTVPGDTVKNVIPSASGEFDVTYTVTSDGELREAVLNGVFYPDTEPMTYTIGFDDYGTEKEITAP